MMTSEVSQKTAYAVRLISKHTGEGIWLGIKHETREDALKYVEKEVCQRCNRFRLEQVPADWHWIGRHEGFREERV